MRHISCRLITQPSGHVNMAFSVYYRSPLTFQCRFLRREKKNFRDQACQLEDLVHIPVNPIAGYLPIDTLNFMGNLEKDTKTRIA